MFQIANLIVFFLSLLFDDENTVLIQASRVVQHFNLQDFRQAVSGMTRVLQSDPRHRVVIIHPLARKNDKYEYQTTYPYNEEDFLAAFGDPRIQLVRSKDYKFFNQVYTAMTFRLVVQT